MAAYRVLTEAQAGQFVEKGYVIIEGCFPKAAAQPWVDLAFKRLGYDPQDRSTWKEPYLFIPGMNSAPVETFAPKAFNAILDVMGGSERINTARLVWGDWFIINFHLGADQPWQPPSRAVGGWHKDGDFFRHFLDSPEQGLLTVVMWTDIYPQGGGTFIAPDSIGPVARYLVEHPEGVLPDSFGHLIAHCNEFLELTGQTGDVALLHPFMLHAASGNPSGRARFMTNPPVALRAPMNFNRANPDEFSLVERAVLRGLGVERLDFQPTVPRERIVPERVRRQQQMLEEQKARLGQESGGA
jgi:hypothetical protein